MTPTTTSEREAREILGREYQKAHAADPRINFCEPEFEVAVRAVMAALTREQREGDGIEGWQRALVDSVHRWREHPQQEAQGVVAWSVFDKRSGRHWYTHDSRTTAQGYADLYSHKEADGSPSQIVTPLYAATPPAPVDVRGLRALAAGWKLEAAKLRTQAARAQRRGDGSDGELFQAAQDAEAYADELLALIDGQPAGVDESTWREGWAFAYSGTRLYGDDGELQDNSEQPFIDWRRDSATEILAKIRERTQPPESRPRWRRGSGVKKMILLSYAAGCCAGMAALTESSDACVALLFISIGIMFYVGTTTQQPRTP